MNRRAPAQVGESVVASWMGERIQEEHLAHSRFAVCPSPALRALKFASHKALNLILWGNLTSDERVVLQNQNLKLLTVEMLSC